MFVNGSRRNEHLYRGPSIDASYQVSVHLAKRFQRRFFRNQPIRNKNCLWWPCLLTDRDKMSTLYRGPSIDASYQVSVHLTKRFLYYCYDNEEEPLYYCYDNKKEPLYYCYDNEEEPLYYCYDNEEQPLYYCSNIV